MWGGARDTCHFFCLHHATEELILRAMGDESGADCEADCVLPGSEEEQERALGGYLYNLPLFCFGGTY